MTASIKAWPHRCFALWQDGHRRPHTLSQSSNRDYFYSTNGSPDYCAHFWALQTVTIIGGNPSLGSSDGTVEELLMWLLINCRLSRKDSGILSHSLKYNIDSIIYIFLFLYPGYKSVERYLYQSYLVLCKVARSASVWKPRKRNFLKATKLDSGIGAMHHILLFPSLKCGDFLQGLHIMCIGNNATCCCVRVCIQCKQSLFVQGCDSRGGTDQAFLLDLPHFLLAGHFHCWLARGEVLLSFPFNSWRYGRNPEPVLWVCLYDVVLHSTLRTELLLAQETSVFAH